jgi:hypothetical protein
VPKDTLAVVGHVGPVADGDRMSTPRPGCPSRSGQPTRLEIFRVLMRAEPGIPAGLSRIRSAVRTTPFNASEYPARSGLVHGTRDGRSIIYRADAEGMWTLIAFLVKDCCDGHPSYAICRCHRGSEVHSDQQSEQMSRAKIRHETRITSLFLCTGNSARSDHGGSGSQSRWARQIPSVLGRKPAEGASPPVHTRSAEKLNYDIASMRSKSWKEFSGPTQARFRVHCL